MEHLEHTHLTAAERIALFLPMLAGGGAERSMLNLAHAFAEKGLEVDLVVASTGGALWEQVPPGINHVDLGRPRVLQAIPASPFTFVSGALLPCWRQLTTPT